MNRRDLFSRIGGLLGFAIAAKALPREPDAYITEAQADQLLAYDGSQWRTVGPNGDYKTLADWNKASFSYTDKEIKDIVPDYGPQARAFAREVDNKILRMYLDGQRIR